MEEETREVVGYLRSKEFVSSFVVIVVASLLLWVIKQYLVKKVAYSGKRDQHKNTFIGMIFNVMQYLVILLTIVIVMKINGINIGSILAGLGIVATIIGLALQDTLKDIIAGINIYNNNFYKVGDMVRWNGEECDVKYFSARVTKFQSIASKSTYTVCNSQIASIEKIKDTKSMYFTFKFDEDRSKIDEALDRTVWRMKDTLNLKKMTYIGIVDLSSEGVTYAIGYECPSHKYGPVRLKLLEIAYNEFKNAGIRPVFNRDYLT